MNKQDRPESTFFERSLRAEALLARRAADDYLVLADATLSAAIDGSRPLRSAERAALAASPLTLRRFKVLAQARHAAWQGSSGMLRAADSGAALLVLETDDGHWALHFVPQDGRWQVVLKLAADAPFAARLMADGAVLTVRDGAGAVILQGSLDVDGECEQAWPMADDPAPHFQQHGAVFSVAAGGGGGGVP
jgi:hypothetical protein